MVKFRRPFLYFVDSNLMKLLCDGEGDLNGLKVRYLVISIMQIMQRQSLLSKYSE